jgi:hypothetical protein
MEVTVWGAERSFQKVRRPTYTKNALNMASHMTHRPRPVRLALTEIDQGYALTFHLFQSGRGRVHLVVPKVIKDVIHPVITFPLTNLIQEAVPVSIRQENG